jgi:hypothetical protein
VVPLYDAVENNDEGQSTMFCSDAFLTVLSAYSYSIVLALSLIKDAGSLNLRVGAQQGFSG